jgi:two-component system response regulator
MERSNPPIELLIVDDSPTDVLMTQEGLDYAHVSSHLNVVEDGVEAMDFLHHRGHYEDAPRPDLILLDLNMPRMDGREVLANIKTDAQLCSIPVVVWSSSKAEDDVRRSYELQANCFISKPDGFSQFLQAIESIKAFWLTSVTLPHSASCAPKVS